MARFGLIGPSYSSQALNADCQTTMNWYPEIIESGIGKSSMALYPTPGTKLFVALPNGPVRKLLEINGRTFFVAGPNFGEIFANGTNAVYFAVANDTLPCTMAASPQQVLIASGGSLYVYQLLTAPNSLNLTAGQFAVIDPNNFSSPTAAPNPVSRVEFMDGFFIALLANSQTFYLSNPFDATNWPGLQKLIVSVSSDNVVSMIVNQRRLALLGRKTSVIYYDSGSSSIFDVDPSGTIENGTEAMNSVVKLDNSIFWLDRDDRGAGVVRRMAGYTPLRVSNHAVEFAIQGYPKADDAVGYGYQDQGHSFYVLNFPTAQHTWVYDVSTGMWHERGYWNAGIGAFSAHKSQTHAFAFGRHLVGDLSSSNVYDMEIPQVVGSDYAFVTDNGNPIRHVRRAPHVSLEFQRIFYNDLYIEAETGLGPQPPLRDGSGDPRDPPLILRWSKDSAHTWSNEYILNCGQAGKFKKRIRKARLGSSKTGMVIEISASDPIPWRLVEGYLNADPGLKPSGRLAKEYAKVA